MREYNFNVKGDLDKVTTRLGQIHTVTIYCPTIDDGMMCFYTTMKKTLSSYMDNENKNILKGVPTIDAMNAYLFTVDFCERRDVDLSMFVVMGGALKIFENLKYVNFEFTNNPIVIGAYNTMITQRDSSGNVSILKEIYKIESIEFILKDMFSQDFIDFMNHFFVDCGYISNSYLKRNFLLIFTYDEYFSFFNMFLNNNCNLINETCPNIRDYLNLFPAIVNEHRPDFRIITDYYEL